MEHTLTTNDLIKWLEQNPVNRIEYAADELECNINSLDDALNIMEQLIHPLEVNCNDLVTLNESQVKAINGSMNYMELLRRGIDTNMQELNKAIRASRKPSQKLLP